MSLEKRECDVARRRYVVQQPVRPEVVSKIKFGEQVTVEIGSAGAKSPAMFHLERKNVFGLFEADQFILFLRFLPEKNVFRAAIERTRFGVVHHLGACGRGVENVGAILKVIADDQVRMAVTINVGKEAGVGIPALSAGN